MTSGREQYVAAIVGALKVRPYFQHVAEGYPVPPPSAEQCPAAYVYLRPWTMAQSTNEEVDNALQLHVALLVRQGDGGAIERAKLQVVEEAEAALMAWYNGPAGPTDAQFTIEGVDPSVLALNPFGHPDLPVVLPPYGAVRMDCRVDIHYQT